MSIPQSLPSFAQAFSSSSLNDPPISNALPPIQSHPTKKRSREDPPPPPRTDRANIDGDTTRQSPITVRIKEEDRDDSQRPPQSPPHHTEPSRDSSATPTVPLSKKRRITLVGAPEHAPSIPVSPAVSTFPLPDDPLTRPILVKQQQKQLPEQRRESALSPPMVSGSILRRSPPGDHLSTSKLPRIGRVSPTAMNRCIANPVASGSHPTTCSARTITPPPLIAQQPLPLTCDQNTKQQQPPVTHSLPPPPISFARRRAAQSGGRRKKPADILISPRGAGPSDPLAPVIQSAPPVADPGRFPMAIPRLPLALNNTQAVRRVAGNVPPTPTRFSLHGNANAAPLITSTVRTMPSPPNPSVSIANVLVPPTPHALHHQTGDKSAFMAPFEVFYDALNDSKQLKGWLSDQLQRSNALMMSLKQQQEKMDEIVEDLVEKRTCVMQEEITMLHQRMESLEEALLAVRAESSTRGQDSSGYGYPQGGKSHQNGVVESSSSSYRFPCSGQRGPDTIIGTSPGIEQEHQPSLSPPVEAARRLSVSGSFTLGGHCRRPSGSQGTVKSTSRPTDSRSASRMYYPGTYGNGSPMTVEGQTAIRDGNKS